MPLHALRFWHRAKCRLGLHDYRLIAHVTPSADHVGCVHCKREWGMHHDARALVPWSDVAGFHAEHYGYQAERYFSLRGSS